jgi:hypothetical protein
MAVGTHSQSEDAAKTKNSHTLEYLMSDLADFVKDIQVVMKKHGVSEFKTYGDALCAIYLSGADQW